MKKYKLLTTSLLVILLVCIFSNTAAADSVPNYTYNEKCTVYMNGTKLDTQAYLRNGNIFVPVSLIEKYGDTTGFTFDTANSVIKFNAKDINAFFGDEDTTRFIKNNAGDLTIRLYKLDYINGTFASLGTIAQLTRLNYVYKNKTVYITQYSSYTDNYFIATGNEAVLPSLDNESDTYSFRENEYISILDETDSYYKVSDASGKSFYVFRDDVEVLNTASSNPSYQRVYKEKDVFSEPINAMWSDLNYIPDPIDGIDVFADITFYPWCNDDGSNYNGAYTTINYGFIEAAHANGYKWWLCAQNFNTGIRKTFSYIDTVLKDRAQSNSLIAKYLFYACVYNADGINIDYEEMDSSSRNYFIYFIQTLSNHANKLGLTTSVCTYCGTAWNNRTIYPYDLLGHSCDFLCEMVYNEDISTSLSAMSQSYYKKGTDYIATLMPKEKILMGVADYTRFTYWSGNTMAGSSWLTMDGVWSDPEGMDISWDEYTGQYFVVQPFRKNGIDYVSKYFIEEGRSSALKAQYIVDNGYGGTIGWQFGYMLGNYQQEKDIYAAYYSIYHNNGTYDDFVPKPSVPDEPQDDNTEDQETGTDQDEDLPPENSPDNNENETEDNLE